MREPNGGTVRGVRDALTTTGHAGEGAGDHAATARRVFWATVATTAAVHLLPFGDVVGYPLLLLSTLVHELGHGLAAEMVGGDFVSLRVFGDGSGVATSASSGGAFARAAVAAGGLVGPAVAAAFGFVVARRAAAARVGLLILGAFLLVASVLWVRGLVGLGVAVVFALLCLGAALVKPSWAWFSQLWLLFTSVQLALSVFSRGDYLFASSARTGAGVGVSDSAALADALVGPVWFWGTVVGLFSVAVLVGGGVAFLHGLRGRRREAGAAPRR